ncbi:MAG: prepilin-type N-terminal cleavage/methylation domain-containing protein, partial [Burkholderiales bacterium]|nr:prepilin-type N-terminal cleavage/methylation domain-containing protein [Burkholderiales bacterium]
PRAATSSPSGITIIELVIALAIVSILASITIPLYNDYRYQAMVSQARSDIVNLDYLIVQFQSDGNGQ